MMTVMMPTATAGTTASRSAGTTAAVATHATTAATTATASVTGQSLGIAPNQGDADDREKDRDAEQNSTIHPKFLQQTGTYQKITTVAVCRTIPPPDGRQRGGTFSSSLDALPAG
jgi:hypothetical protein